MKKTFVAIVIFILLGSIDACSLQAPLDRRWSQPDDPLASIIPDSPEDTPELSVVAIQAEAAASPKVKDLPDHAGAAYFEELGKFSKSAAEFTKLAATPIEVASKSIDTTSFTRTLVINVSKGKYRPGDRLVRTKVRITPETNSNFIFSNYTVAATAYTTVNIDSITTNRSKSLGAELNPTFAGGLVGAGKVSASSTQSTADTSQISQQIEQLTVSIDPAGSIIIYRESERGLDLTGSTLIKISLKQKDINNPQFVEEPFIVTALSVFKDDKALAPDKASVTASWARITKPVEYKVNASLEYVMRRIVKGAATYNESDDTIKFTTNPPNVSQEFILIPKSDMEVPRWVLRDGDNGLDLMTATGDKQLTFKDYVEAQQFSHWLEITHATIIGNQKLSIFNSKSGAQQIDPKHFPMFQVFRSDT